MKRFKIRPPAVAQLVEHLTTDPKMVGLNQGFIWNGETELFSIFFTKILFLMSAGKSLLKLKKH